MESLNGGLAFFIKILKLNVIKFEIINLTLMGIDVDMRNEGMTNRWQASLIIISNKCQFYANIEAANIYFSLNLKTNHFRLITLHTHKLNHRYIAYVISTIFHVSHYRCSAENQIKFYSDVSRGTK